MGKTYILVNRIDRTGYVGGREIQLSMAQVLDSKRGMIRREEVGEVFDRVPLGKSTISFWWNVGNMHWVHVWFATDDAKRNGRVLVHDSSVSVSQQPDAREQLAVMTELDQHASRSLMVRREVVRPLT